jgi:(p)ppGpp synthase/HD superfamily hydrolase
LIYTDLTKKALLISFNAHKNQVDKSGMPYVYHPYHVAEQMKSEISTCVALLHDVVEDTDITLDDLKAQGFPDEVINALSLLTHKKNIPYMDYVKAIKENPIATEVKLADLGHNSDYTRIGKLETLTEADRKRLAKYNKAILLLTAYEDYEIRKCPNCGKSVKFYFNEEEGTFRIQNHDCKVV